MDPFDRIQQLEDELRVLRQQAEESAPASLPASDPDLPAPAQAAPAAGGRMVRRAGTLWSDQLAVVVVMSVMVMLLAYALTRSEGTSPWGRVWAVTGGGALALGVGLASRGRQRAFGNTAAGIGLAVLYFAGFGMVYLPGMGPGVAPTWGASALLGLITALAIVAGLARSQLAAGLLMTAVYGSLALCCTYLRDAASLQYAFAAITLPPLLVTVYHLSRRWRPLSTWVLVCAYACLFTFFMARPTEWAQSEEAYARVALVVATAVFAAGTLTGLLDGRRTGGFAPSVSALMLANTSAYVLWVMLVVIPAGGMTPWILQVWLALCIASVGLLAEGLVCRRSLPARVHLTVAVAVLVFALAALLSAARLWAALSLTGLALAAAYALTRVEVLLLLNTVVLAVTFFGAVSVSGQTGTVTLWGWTFPSSSFVAVTVSMVWLVTAWTLTHALREPLAERRRRRGGIWKRVRLRKPTVALMHAGAAAVLLALVTSLEAGEDPRLPFVLGTLALAVWAAGFLSFAPVVRLASVFLLASAHAAFHFLLWVNRPVFEGQPRFLALTLALAGLTLAMGWGWERTLLSGRHRHGYTEHLLAWAPAIAAVVLAMRLTGAMTPVAIVLLLQGTGILLILAGCATRGMSFAVGGVFAMVAGTRLYLRCLDMPESFAGDTGIFLSVLIAMLASYVVAERMLRLLELRERSLTRLDDLLRTVLVAGAGMVGLLALNKWFPEDRLGLYWALLGLGCLAASLLLRESRYRWAGVLVLMTAAFAMLLTPGTVQRLAGGVLLATLVGGALWLHHRMSHPPGVPERGGETPLRS
jgi:hypothetical protein